MTHAYNELYLDSAQQILGDAVDFSIRTLHMKPETFSDLFCMSDISKQFATGNPAYVAGVTGPELVEQIFFQCGLPTFKEEPVLRLQKGKAFWSGWALAFYQWRSARSFSAILQTVSLDTIFGMYTVYHETDPEHFADAMERTMQEETQATRLAIYRKALGLSQRDLSRLSGVPLRQVQLFEQRERDINKTQGNSLEKLSRALHCPIEGLLEK